MKKWLFVAVLGMVFIPGAARADVSLLVLEAVGVAGEYTGSGHTAIYLSNICAENPVSLRLCRAGERGVVITNYPSFGDREAYEWMAIPLVPFLYGVENERDIPLYANGDIRNFLRETYRRKHFKSLIPSDEAGTMPKGGWRTMLTMAFNRDIYSFNIRTTVDEDAEFLREFNALPNENGFNSFTRNCADFSRKLINRYFPGAARRDVLNDFGITTPKAVARSVTKYSSARPERLFHVTKYPQVTGSIWRSFDNRNFTEMAFKSKKYLIPSIIFEPPLIPIFAATYYLTGRYNLDKTYREYATPQIARLNLEKHRLSDKVPDRSTRRDARREISRKIKAERTMILGEGHTWKAYRDTFAPILSNAIAQGLFQDAQEVKTFFRDLELQSEPAFDKDGSLILKVSYYGENRTLGINRHNILSPNSDRELALKLMLAKMNAELNASEKNRGSFEEFQANWKLMRQLLTNVPASSLPMVAKNRGRFLVTPPPTSVKRKIEKLVIAITR